MSEIYIFTPVVFQALLIPTSALKFSKATNLVHNSFRYCFLLSMLFYFFRLKLLIYNLRGVCSFTAILFLTFPTTTRQSSLLKHCKFYLFFPSEDRQVYSNMLHCENIAILAVTILHVAKFATTNRLALLTSC